MNTRQIVDIFTEGVTSHQLGDQPIANLHNGNDCFILNFPTETEKNSRPTSTWLKTNRFSWQETLPNGTPRRKDLSLPTSKLPTNQPQKTVKHSTIYAMIPTSV